MKQQPKQISIMKKYLNPKSIGGGIAFALLGLFAGSGINMTPESALATCERNECEPFIVGRICKPNPYGMTLCQSRGFLSCKTYACPVSRGYIPPRPRPE